MLRRRIPPALIAGILWIPAIGASAQELPPLTTTTTEAPETTTTTEAPVETTTTTEAPEETTTTTEAEAPLGGEELGGGEENMLGGGSLSISVPASAVLSTGTPADAGTIESELGEVTVTDSRGAINASWTATVSTTTFTTGDGTAYETIDREYVSYWSGAATATDGVGTFVPGQLLPADAETLDVSRTAFALVGSVGDTSATWNPTIIVTIPETAVVGTYEGTITHSVA